MNRLKQKLKSESGASILIALLFFLICALVAASLLMAAVSNAGKIKSNQEMHQKYLTVSSALELVCDDLTGAEYYGQYSFRKEESTGGSAGQTVNIHYYEQQQGQYDCQLASSLIGDLDAIFAEQMEADITGFPEVDNVKNHAVTFPHPGTENSVRTFIVEPAATDGINLGKVQITVTVDRKSYTINLTARLVEDAAYGMEAELTPVASNFPHIREQSKEGVYKTEAMTWKVGWITKASSK